MRFNAFLDYFYFHHRVAKIFQAVAETAMSCFEMPAFLYGMPLLNAKISMQMLLPLQAKPEETKQDFPSIKQCWSP